MNQRQRAAKDKAVFLVELRACGDWAEAARRTGRSRDTTNGWRRNDPTFRRESQQALSVWSGRDGLKKCSKCHEVQDLSQYHFRSERQSYRTVCKSCKREGQKERYLHYKTHSWFKHRCVRAKSRSQSIGVPFNLTEGYLESIWTGFCPITGIKLDPLTDKDSEFAVELDRFKPDLGYIKGNVHWVSRRANRLKNSATAEELRSLLKWMEEVENDRG